MAATSAQRIRRLFGLLIIVQAAHSVEEYVGRLYDVFPPARLLAGLVSEDRRAGFIVLNFALVSFGIWSYFWPVRRAWPSARVLLGIWATVELINGVVHPLWSVSQGGYTPGVLTAFLLLPVALALALALRSHVPENETGSPRDGASENPGGDRV